MAELKPCPFCGGKNTKVSFKRKHARYNCYGNYLEWCSASVRCTKCHARGSVVSGDVFHGTLHEREKLPEGTTTEAELKKAAIEAWNNRIPQTTVNQFGENCTNISNCGTLNLNL